MAVLQPRRTRSYEGSALLAGHRGEKNNRGRSFVLRSLTRLRSTARSSRGPMPIPFDAEHFTFDQEEEDPVLLRHLGDRDGRCYSLEAIHAAESGAITYVCFEEEPNPPPSVMVDSEDKLLAGRDCASDWPPAPGSPTPTSDPKSNQHREPRNILHALIHGGWACCVGPPVASLDDGATVRTVLASNLSAAVRAK